MANLKQARALLLGAITATTALFTSTSFANTDNGELVDKVIATVNDQIILKSELTAKVFEQAQIMASQNIPVKDTNALANKVLDNIVLEKLQLERAQLIGLKATDEEVNQQLQKIASQNNISIFELRNRLNLEAPNGFLRVRKDIEKQILIQKLREREVISQAYVTESEIQNFLKRQSLDKSSMAVKLSHILIALPESPTTAERNQALDNIKNIKKRLDMNDNFAQLAVRYSNGSNALKGGDLGWVEENQVPSFFSKSLNTLELGQVSDVIESPSGFHIIKLEGKKDLNKAKNKTEYHLHRFIILTENTDANAVPKEIAEIASSMDSIQDFQALFDRYKDIATDLNNDSDLGWRTLDRIPSVIQQDVAALSPKNALPPLVTDGGWMILYLDDTREINEATEEERQTAMQTIRMRKANEMFDLWLRRLKDEAYIQVKASN